MTERKKPGFFEPGMLYQHTVQGSEIRVVAHFHCQGVGPHPDGSPLVAVGYWRRVWASGAVGRWQLIEFGPMTWEIDTWVPPGKIISEI